MSPFPSTHWTLIREARGGDEEAARALFDRYRGAVLGYLRRRGGPSAAEDLVQDVFLRLFRGGALDRAEPVAGRFRSLVLAVARNALGHHLDREHASRRGGGRVRPLGDCDVAGDEPDPTFDREWLRHLLARALDRLAEENPEYHEAIRLHRIEGKSQEEVAVRMGGERGDVRNRVHRGRRKLAALLREEIREYSSSAEDFEEELRYLARILDPSGSEGFFRTG